MDKVIGSRVVNIVESNKGKLEEVTGGSMAMIISECESRMQTGISPQLANKIKQEFLSFTRSLTIN